MGEIIQFNRPDGKTCPGYLAVPKSGANAPGFVVIQEWWGLNDQIKKTADRLAGAGHRALVPDLFRGKIATASDEANHLMASLNLSGTAFRCWNASRPLRESEASVNSEEDSNPRQA